MHLRPPPLSEEFLATLRAVARQAFGQASPEGSLLAAAVRDVSHYYTRDREQVERTGHDMAPLAARLRFFLPRDLYKLWSPLSELWTLAKLPRREPLRVLDLGAGLGTSTLGVLSFAAHVGAAAKVEVTACDRDARALAVMERLVAAPVGLDCVPARVNTREVDLARPNRWSLPRKGFDLVIAGLCLNELTAHEDDEDARTDTALDWLRGAFEHVAEDGALIVLEPALRSQSRLLQRVRDALQANGPPHVFAPCLGIAGCPMLERERDWCHDRMHYALPDALADLARGAGLRTGDLTYSYLTLRHDSLNLSAIAGPGRVAFRVVGGPGRSKGKLELDLCGGASAPRLQRLDRHRDRRHDVLAGAQRGTLLGLRTDDCAECATASRLRIAKGQDLLVYRAQPPDLPSAADPDRAVDPTRKAPSPDHQP